MTAANAHHNPLHRSFQFRTKFKLGLVGGVGLVGLAGLARLVGLVVIPQMLIATRPTRPQL